MSWTCYEFGDGYNLLVGQAPGDYCLLPDSWTKVTGEELGAGFHDESSEEFRRAVWADWYEAKSDYDPTEVLP